MQAHPANTTSPATRRLQAARPGVSRLAASTNGSKIWGVLARDDGANSTSLSKASPPRVDTQSQAEAASPWEIKTLLGHGVQGMVWHAIMKQDGRHVAIKCLHRHHLSDTNSASSQQNSKHLWSAFRNEIDILETCGSSGHPNIVQILGKAADYSQMMLEKADMDLTARLRARGYSLSLDQCHRWSKDLLFGVRHLHALGITHTDLKPENMLIGNQNQIKICDFGSAHKGEPGTPWTVVGELSTLWYRAPELLLGSKTFDHKIDLWAIGCIMMEMLCGEAVFQGQVGPQFASTCPDATHRNFNSDQVHKVLSMAGTPGSLIGFECARLIKGWPPFQRNVEPTVVRYCDAKVDAHGNSSASWAQAVGGLLMTLPGERSSCSEVLAMPLFEASSLSIQSSMSSMSPGAAADARLKIAGKAAAEKAAVEQAAAEQAAVQKAAADAKAAAEAKAAGVGTHFTRITGTKVQILTQKAAEAEAKRLRELILEFNSEIASAEAKAKAEAEGGAAPAKAPAKAPAEAEAEAQAAPEKVALHSADFWSAEAVAEQAAADAKAAAARETALILEKMRVFYSRFNAAKAGEVDLVWQTIKTQHHARAAAELNKALRVKYGCDLSVSDEEQLRIAGKAAAEKAAAELAAQQAVADKAAAQTAAAEHAAAEKAAAEKAAADAKAAAEANAAGGGTHFTCFTSTKVQILTQRAASEKDDFRESVFFWKSFF